MGPDGRSWIEFLRERVDAAGWQLEVVENEPYVRLVFGTGVEAAAWGRSVDECALRLWGQLRRVFPGMA